MKYWIQFLGLSTGYIAGKIPPQFGKPELIDACGDTGVFILDGRMTQQNMKMLALKKAQRLQHWKKYEAFVICSGPRLFEETKRSKIHPLTYPVQV